MTQTDPVVVSSAFNPRLEMNLPRLRSATVCQRAAVITVGLQQLITENINSSVYVLFCSIKLIHPRREAAEVLNCGGVSCAQTGGNCHHCVCSGDASLKFCIFVFADYAYD